MIRIATIEDAADLREIYRYYVENTAITFEYEVPSVSEFEERIRKTLERFPYYVMEEDGVILGYAYAGAFATRPAYSWGAEISIYLLQGQTKKGYGKQLYRQLENTLQKLGYQTAYACIATPIVEDETLTRNSVDYHLHMGYRLVGEFYHCGFKFQRWYHMVWMEKPLGDYPLELELPRLFKEFREEYDNVNI